MGGYEEEIVEEAILFSRLRRKGDAELRLRVLASRCRRARAWGRSEITPSRSESEQLRPGSVLLRTTMAVACAHCGMPAASP